MAEGPNRSRASEAYLDRLFETAPEDFVAIRNELVAKLNAMGKRQVASELKALGRPTVPVWAINRLARREPNKVAALLDAANQLRNTQARALRNRASAEHLRSTVQAEREALRTLLRSAQEVLREANRADTPGLLGRVESTLHAHAVGNPADRELLRRGRLSREAQALGFAGLLDSPGAATATRQPRLAAAQGPAQRRQARAERRAAQQAANRLRAAATRAQRIAERVKARAQRLAAEAARAQAEAASAEQSAADARRRRDEALRKIELTQG
jgi:hypothetical protein